jgi:hypothetical protein
MVATKSTSDAGRPPHQACPRCGREVHRSKAKRIDQQIRKWLTAQRLYRCHSCQWRGWMFPMDPAVNVSLPAKPDPDLAALDALSPDSATPAPPSSTKDLP